MNIAIWGYMDFGRRMSESLRRYWGGRYTIAGIYDSSKAGAYDCFWDIAVSYPGQIKADFEKGLFEKIIVCIVAKPERDEIIKELDSSGIPVLFPGDPADFLPAEELT